MAGKIFTSPTTGKNILYHNNGNGTFTDVSDKAGSAAPAKLGETGCAFIDYDRDGHLDLMVSNYVDFDLSKHACTRRAR